MNRVAIYARTSTNEQDSTGQLLALREFCDRRGWKVVREYVDDGISGTKDSRPALDELTRDAKRRRFDILVAWRLDRLGRSLRGLVLLLDEITSAGVTFTSVSDGIDLGSPSGRFMTHMLAALAEYERQIIVERVRLGLARARKQGKHLGRPRAKVTAADLAAVADLSLSKAAARLRVSKSAVAKWRRAARAA